MNEINNCLAHYGVPGMKWGRRKVRQDLNGLAKRANDYYSALNKYNQDVDSGTKPSNEQLADIVRKRDSVANNVKELVERYGDARVEPKFESDGYTVKAVNVAIGRLDSLGRLDKVSIRGFKPRYKKKKK